MVDANEKTRITVEDLMAFDEDRWIEIVDGEIVEQDQITAGYLHIIITENLYDVLKQYLKTNKLGRVHTDGLTYILEEREGVLNRTRIPDVSFIRKSSIPEEFNWERPFPGAPTLAVEVTSPGQSIDDMSARIRDYFEFGTEQVWVIHAIGREVYQYRHDNPDIVHIYHGEGEIIAEALFPGLKIPVSRLFVVDED
jgi:Uma2 family endonuclease